MQQFQCSYNLCFYPIAHPVYIGLEVLDVNSINDAENV